MSLAIEAESIRKDFGTIRALDVLTFTVNSGEIYGLIGLNGAGKTTCLRIVSTLLLPTSGSTKVFGIDVVQKPAAVRRMITYLPKEAGAYRNLSGWEYLRFMVRFVAGNEADFTKMINEGAEICGLGERP